MSSTHDHHHQNHSDPEHHILDDDVFEDFHFSYLVIAGLLSIVVLIIKGIVVAELYNFIAPRMTDTKIKKLSWGTAILIAILFDILI
jgi:hypothetical protein